MEFRMSKRPTTMSSRVVAATAGFLAIGAAVALIARAPDRHVEALPRLVWGIEMSGNGWGQGTGGRYASIEECRTAVLAEIAAKPAFILQARCIRYSGYSGYEGRWDWTGGIVVERVPVLEPAPVEQGTPI
jgi:hypothetical protein